MSNLSSYSLIDDDHIDDQETINVGNLIIDLESDLEKEKIVSEQANHNVNLENNARCSTSNPTNIPSSTSQAATPSSSSTNHFNNKTIILNKTSSNNFDSPKQSGKSNQKQHANRKDLGSSNAHHNSGSINNNGHTLTARTVFKSSADERGELKMKITRETKPAKNDHRVVTSPNQKSPTSSSGGGGGNSAMNSNIADQISNHEDSSLSDFRTKQSSISSTKECGTSTSIGTITEPDCLGPCEPGTSVTLEGIVWQETDGGILVVNVTWRGKTYVGALLDCTRHDWAPPRLCDSPASDIDAKTSKGVRSKRIVTRSNGIGLDEKNLLQTTGKLRNGKGRRIPPTNDPTCSKKQRETTDKPSNETSSAQLEANTLQTNMSSTNSETCVPMSVDTPNSNTPSNNGNLNNNNDQQESASLEASNISIDKAGPSSPQLIGCNEPNCSKKYRNMNGLLYHQSHAHSAENASPNSQDDPVTKDAEPQLKSDNRNHSPPIKIADQEQGPSSPKNRDDITASKPATELERRPPSGNANVPSGCDAGRKSPNNNQRHQEQMNHASSSSLRNSQPVPTSRPTPHMLKQPPIPQPPLPTLTEEGMKPSGTSTGPPPAPHQANCYFNPAFLANTFNPYGIQPYFPRHMYDQLTPPSIPTSNAAFLSRFMNNMRVPPPPDSPSRLLSPSMPKNVPFPPFKIDPSVLPPVPPHPHPHQLPTSHPLSSMPPMSNPQMPPLVGPPAPPMTSLPGGPPNLRMPSQADSLLTPNSQPPFLPPGALNPALGIPGMGNPLGPLMPNLIEEQMAKQFPRRLN